MQTDEEAKILRMEEMRKLEVQLKTSNDHLSKLQLKLDDSNESNRIITQASRIKQEELETLKARLESTLAKKQVGNALTSRDQIKTQREGALFDDVDITGTDARFSLDTSTSDVILLKGKSAHSRTWLDAREVNKLLKRAQVASNSKELLVELLARCYGVMMLYEETKLKLKNDALSLETQIGHLRQKNDLLQDKLGSEEEAKRRTLLRYIRAVKSSPSVAGDQSTVRTIQLPESAITDEELHAIAALLRCDTTIQELSLHNNDITDDGAHALASVLSGETSLRSVDLRGNMVTHDGIRVIAEALERSSRVRHVYVHAGGKIEALGLCQWGVSTGSSENNPTMTEIDDTSAMANVETICCVDCRDSKVPTPKGKNERTTLIDKQPGPTSGRINLKNKRHSRQKAQSKITPHDVGDNNSTTLPKMARTKFLHAS